MESGTIEQLPGLGAHPASGPAARGVHAIGLTPHKRLTLVSGSSNPDLAQKIAEQLQCELSPVTLKTLRERRDVLPLRGVDPRRRHVHRPDVDDPGRPGA